MIPEDYNGPRIVINPTTFKNQKDALCVSFNEAFRIVMSDMQFDPVSEPTERQRRFFSDTAYANDETQLRRTILARICTFDTSVKDPTDEQLEEAVEFLDSVMEAGIPQNEWEQSAVQRIRDVIGQSVGRPQAAEEAQAEEAQAEEAQAEEAHADYEGGETEESTDDPAEDRPDGPGESTLSADTQTIQQAQDTQTTQQVQDTQTTQQVQDALQAQLATDAADLGKNGSRLSVADRQDRQRALRHTYVQGVSTWAGGPGTENYGGTMPGADPLLSGRGGRRPQDGGAGEPLTFQQAGPTYNSIEGGIGGGDRRKKPHAIDRTGWNKF